MNQGLLIPNADSKIFSVTTSTLPSRFRGNVPGESAQCHPDGVFHVGPQALASLARPLGPAAGGAGPSAGFGPVDYVENRATSGRIIHSDFNRAENIYLHAYENGTQLRRGLTEYFHFYNARRTHQALDYQTPDDVYYGRADCRLAA